MVSAIHRSVECMALNKSHDDFSSKKPGSYQDNSTYGSVSENYDSGGDGGGGE